MSSLRIKGYTKRRLLAAAKLGLATIPFAIVLRYMVGYSIHPGSIVMGFGAGFAVGLAELFLLRNLLKNTPFLVHLLGKSLILVGVLYVTFAVLNLLDVFIDGASWEQYFQTLTQAKTLFAILMGLGLITFLLFFLHLDRLLGPGLLLGYISGRYHRPRRENRIFMFLDLKGSTTIADKMDSDQYFAFLNRYFTEMSESILETDAEIYQYVGDEVVLTWKMKPGLSEASCIRVFFLIEDQIELHRDFFLKTYGVVPEFKAGVHAGEVIVARIGELKSEIVFNGDVLNTSARIQAQCNSLGQKLLVSSELINKLSLGPAYTVTDIGSIPLRGKEAPIKLCGVSRTA